MAFTFHTYNQKLHLDRMLGRGELRKLTVHINNISLLQENLEL